ncbi:MAG: ATP-grasp domain-containing protein [Fibrobacterota bacterium]|nr:MAG: ATP-grasp domain-containing protein [Fibrobacterota bacterium]
MQLTKADKRKILILGASLVQVPMIVRAKELGFHVATCDNRPENPGHVLADASFSVSTTDREGVLKIAEANRVDGIVVTSDSAAPTAAWVASKLGLPTHPSESVDILCDKSRFRSFLRANGFKTPDFVSLGRGEDPSEIVRLGFPLLVKPVDSSGSRGVSVVHQPDRIPAAIAHALDHSRSGHVIAEEYIEPFGHAITGEGFSVDGKLVFRMYTNDLRDPIFPLYSVCVTLPLEHDSSTIARIDREIQRAFDLLQLRTGPYNFDIRIDSQGNPVLMEIAPRIGGGGMPQMARACHGVDLLGMTLLSATGHPVHPGRPLDSTGCWAAYELNSLQAGVFRALSLDPDFERDHVKQLHLTTASGERIGRFGDPGGIIGFAVLHFDAVENQEQLFGSIRRSIQVLVD